jgi:aminoglycoside phosphotransferase (APT) family kinase protein
VAEVPTDRAAVLRLLTRMRPDFHPTRVVPIGSGLDNIAFEVDGELVVRCRRDLHGLAGAEAVRREAGLLRLLQRSSPLPVPRVRFVLPEAGCLGYAKLPGTPLLHRPKETVATAGKQLAPALGAFLAALHAIPHGSVRHLVDVDATPPTARRDEAAQTYRGVRGEVPAAHRPAIEAFLRAAPPPLPAWLVFSHNDLGIEHVLVDDTARVTGVIDWSDAALTDPAYDFGLLLRDLGRRALERALRAYGTARPESLRRRAVFHARCALLEDLAYGLETGRGRYVDKSTAGMGWLFSPR